PPTPPARRGGRGRSPPGPPGPTPPCRRGGSRESARGPRNPRAARPPSARGPPGGNAGRTPPAATPPAPSGCPPPPPPPAPPPALAARNEVARARRDRTRVLSVAKKHRGDDPALDHREHRVGHLPRGGIIAALAPGLALPQQRGEGVPPRAEPRGQPPAER